MEKGAFEDVPVQGPFIELKDLLQRCVSVKMSARKENYRGFACGAPASSLNHRFGQGMAIVSKITSDQRSYSPSQWG